MVLTIIHLLRVGVVDFSLPFVVEVGGHYVEVDILTVLNLYLYLTVGAPARLETGEIHVAPGGYLGVQGNITLTMYAFTARLEELSFKIRPYQMRLRGQVGGDDFALRYLQSVYIKGNSGIVSRLCHDTITAYVGHLKEWIMLKVVPPVDTHPFLFCRKRVHITTTATLEGARIKTSTEHHLPLFGTLVEIEDVPRSKKVSHYMRFRSSVKEALKTFPDADFLSSFFLDAYCRTYGFRGGWKTSVEKLMVGHELIFTHGTVMTHRGLRLVNKLPTQVSSLGVPYAYKDYIRVSLLLKRGIFEIHEVTIGDARTPVYLTETEATSVPEDVHLITYVEAELETLWGESIYLLLKSLRDSLVNIE